MSEQSERATFRCDGCGKRRHESERHDFRRSSGNRRASYGRRCERLRDMYNLRPGDHEQYLIEQEIAEIEGWSQ